MSPLLFMNNHLKTSDRGSSERLFFGKQWADFTLTERVTLFIIALTPALYLGVRHWVTNLSVVAVIAAIYSLVKIRDKVQLSQIPHIKAISWIFLIYLLAIFISQLGRLDFVYRPYLDQGRWVVGLPIFIYLYYARLNFAKVLDWILPICIFSAYVSSVYLIPSEFWGYRSTVSFMDPLMFGFTNLTLAMVCFASVAVDVFKRTFSVNTAIKVIAFVLGIYLSIRSVSRSGWGAFPIVIILTLYLLYKPSFWRGLLFSFIVISISVVIYLTIDLVKIRVDLLIMQLRQYPWESGVAPDNSENMRVTFYRLGYYYFSQSPFFGWGDRGYGAIKDAPALLTFSSQFTRDFAFGALFHSEWTTQAVRFGVLGVLGVFWVFFFPIKMFIQFAKLGDEYLRVSCMGTALMICLLVSSVGDEVFNHKMSVTFSAIVIAGLLATGLSLKKNTTN